jgi:hypothetical protein
MLLQDYLDATPVMVKQLDAVVELHKGKKEENQTGGEATVS